MLTQQNSFDLRCFHIFDNLLKIVQDNFSNMVCHYSYSPVLPSLSLMEVHYIFSLLLGNSSVR